MTPRSYRYLTARLPAAALAGNAGVSDGSLSSYQDTDLSRSEATYAREEFTFTGADLAKRNPDHAQYAWHQPLENQVTWQLACNRPQAQVILVTGLPAGYQLEAVTCPDSRGAQPEARS